VQDRGAELVQAEEAEGALAVVVEDAQIVGRVEVAQDDLEMAAVEKITEGRMRLPAGWRRRDRAAILPEPAAGRSTIPAPAWRSPTGTC